MKTLESASELRAAVETFFDAEILPRHREWVAYVAEHPGAPPFLAGLRARARELGLWNLWRPDRLSNRDYAPIAEIMGRLPWASRRKIRVRRSAISLLTSNRFIILPDPVGHSILKLSP